MNLFAFLNRGARHADILADRASQAHQLAIEQAAESSRAQWLNALLVDQTRAWMSVGEADLDVLTGLSIMLTIAGFCSMHDTKDAESPDLRVLRGAISAVTQCAASSGVVSVADARAFTSACTRASAIIEAASVGAIVHAARSIRLTVGMADEAAYGAPAAVLAQAGVAA